SRSVQQGSRGFRVVSSIEVAKVPGLVAPRVEPNLVDGGRRASYELAVPPSRKQHDFRMAVKRIFGRIQAFSQNELERCDPVRIVFEHLISRLDEVVRLFAWLMLTNLHGRHA